MPYDMNFSNFQNTIIFGDAYPDVDEFLLDYNEYNQQMGLSEPDQPISQTSARILYMLLYGQYANSSFANYDLNQVKAKLFSIVFMYGPTWQKRSEIQKKLRNLTDDEIFTGTKQIMNSAQNPGTIPTAQDLESLPYINSQNTSTYKKSKTAGYAELWELLRVDVNREFIDKFAVLFRKVIAPSAPLYYHNDPEATQL